MASPKNTKELSKPGSIRDANHLQRSNSAPCSLGSRRCVVPGRSGIPIFGDDSIEFYKDAIAFCRKRVAKFKSNIFQCRILNKPTVIITSNDASLQVVSDTSGNLDMGYHLFMNKMYDDTLIFTNGPLASDLRGKLQLLFNPDFLEKWNQTINRSLSEALLKVKLGNTTDIYPVFKQFATDVCISSFLGIDLKDKDLIKEISTETTLHWHGLVSIPFKLSGSVIPSSQYSKALAAKKNLEVTISECLEKKEGVFSHLMSSAQFPEEYSAVNHTLLFVSALVPKALASLLTSFVSVLADKPKIQDICSLDPQYLELVLLEVQRLWPPFICGRRVTNSDFLVAGYTVPPDYAVIYMTKLAQVDPDVFNKPDEFLPERWLGDNKKDRHRLVLFGGGNRHCIGEHLVQQMLQIVCLDLCRNFRWSTVDNELVLYKWLPVTKRKGGGLVEFFARTGQE